jgi:ribose transport system permease protein
VTGVPVTGVLPGPPPGQQAGPARFSRARLGDLQRRYPLLQVIALIALYVYGAVTISGFASKSALYSMGVQAALLGLAGAGQTIVVLGGGIDFSVGAFITAGDVIVTQLMGKNHWPFAAAVAAALVIAVIGGIVNGAVSRRFLIEPLIVTLGVGALLTGLITVWIDGAVTGSAPAWLGTLTSPIGTTFGIPVPPVIVIWAVVAIVIGVVLARTKAGRSLYLTGTNPRAARLALVRVGRTWVAAFVISAVLATVVGVLLAGYSGSGDITIGDPYLFESLTAVIVGGTMFGGRGDYWRTVLGALLLSVVTEILGALNFSSAIQQMIYGALIMGVVAAYGRDRKLRDRV